jgi:hypothetical protein
MIPCSVCLHHVLLRFENDTFATGMCTHCQAGYQVTVTKTRESPLSEDDLKNRMNRHMGD